MNNSGSRGSRCGADFLGLEAGSTKTRSGSGLSSISMTLGQEKAADAMIVVRVQQRSIKLPEAQTVCERSWSVIALVWTREEESGNDRDERRGKESHTLHGGVKC
jgi:hypothetical protein